MSTGQCKRWQLLKLLVDDLKFFRLQLHSCQHRGAPTVGDQEAPCSLTVLPCCPLPLPAPTNMEAVAGKLGAPYSPGDILQVTGNVKGVHLGLPAACLLFKGLECHEPSIREPFLDVRLIVSWTFKKRECSSTPQLNVCLLFFTFLNAKNPKSGSGSPMSG